MLAVIGGTGLNSLPGLEHAAPENHTSPWATGPVSVTRGLWQGQPLLFLPRHGAGHRLPPHRVNYRANIDALRLAGATRIIGVAAVGGIRADMAPATLVLPDDLIDYSWGRAQTFSDGESDSLQHIEFAPPYDAALRGELAQAASVAGVELISPAVHGVTQGPRLETAAEIVRMRRDGCDIVGMTGMPEAALAREAGLAYACLAVVVNWAAGIGEGAIHAEIEASIETGMQRVAAVLRAFCQARPGEAAAP